MGAQEDLQAAIAAEDTVIDQAIAFIQGVPAATQAAVDAALAGNNALAASITADVKTHADNLSAALAAAKPAP